MRPFMVFTRLGTIACSLVLIPATQAGKVSPARIDELVEASERIVLAKVEAVQDGPNQKVHRAKATVKEVWKGPKVETVEYQRDRGLGITVYFDQRKGSASSADLSNQAITDMVAKACAIARHTAPVSCNFAMSSHE